MSKFRSRGHTLYDRSITGRSQVQFHAIGNSVSRDFLAVDNIVTSLEFGLFLVGPIDNKMYLISVHACALDRTTSCVRERAKAVNIEHGFWDLRMYLHFRLCGRSLFKSCGDEGEGYVSL